MRCKAQALEKYWENVWANGQNCNISRNFTENCPFQGKPSISRSASRPWNREIGWALRISHGKGQFWGTPCNASTFCDHLLQASVFVWSFVRLSKQQGQQHQARYRCSPYHDRPTACIYPDVKRSRLMLGLELLVAAGVDLHVNTTSRCMPHR